MFSKWFKQSPKIETVRKINPSSLPTQKKAGPIDQRSNQKRKELPEKMKAKKQSNLKKPPQQPKKLPSQMEPKTFAEAEFTKPALSSDSALNLQGIIDQVTRLTDAIPKIEEIGRAHV